MAFDVDRMERKVLEEVATFAPAHLDETFFAFAVDANLLCLNSLEDWQATLAKYQAKYPEIYTTREQIADLRKNTGDWGCQGFAQLGFEDGFDDFLYGEHYDEAMNTDDGRAPWTEYAKAMNSLVDRLRSGHAFDSLRRADDFEITWVDHNY